MFSRHQQVYETAETVRADHWRRGAFEHAGRIQHRHLLGREQVHRIVLAVIGVTHAGKGHGRNLILLGEIGRDEIPPMGMRAIAMHE